MKTVQLSDSKLNKRYIIITITTNEKVKSRLKNLGVFPLQKIEVLAFSYLDNNVLISVSNNFVGLRVELAENIVVSEVN